MSALFNLLYSLSLALWVGGMVVFSFLVTPAIFQNFPRERAGEVVGALIPRYFAFGLALTLLALVSYFVVRHQAGTAPWGDWARIALLLVMLGGTGANAVVLGPKAAQIKIEKKAAATDEAREALGREFGKLHGISMAVNATVLLCGLALLVMGALHPIGPAPATPGSGAFERLGL